MLPSLSWKCRKEVPEFVATSPVDFPRSSMVILTVHESYSWGIHAKDFHCSEHTCDESDRTRPAATAA
jgi:hypothetical protein